MKTKLLTLMMAVALFTNVMAEESNVWYDIDFSTDEWLDAFNTALAPLLASDGINPLLPTGDLRTADAKEYNWNNAISVGEEGFSINGNVFKESEPFTSECGKEFQYSVRFRNGNTSFIEFPIVENAGKITLYVQNPNQSNSPSTIDIGITVDELISVPPAPTTPEEWDDVADWNRLANKAGEEIGAGKDAMWRPNFPLKRFDVPAKDPYPDDGGIAQGGLFDQVLTYDININEPVKMRIFRNVGQFIKVFRIVLEKFPTDTSVQPSFLEKITLSVAGKTLSLSGNVSNAGLSIFDLAGKQILNCKVNSDKIDLQNINAGVYIAKLITEQGETTQKIVIN